MVRPIKYGNRIIYIELGHNGRYYPYTSRWNSVFGIVSTSLLFMFNQATLKTAYETGEIK